MARAWQNQTNGETENFDFRYYETVRKNASLTGPGQPALFRTMCASAKGWARTGDPEILQTAKSHPKNVCSKSPTPLFGSTKQGVRSGTFETLRGP